jgi:hypothetical protein
MHVKTSEVFLDPEDIATLTGIRKGRGGKTRCERQIAWLRQSGIPFWVNACGRPIVARAAVEAGACPRFRSLGWLPIPSESDLIGSAVDLELVYRAKLFPSLRGEGQWEGHRLGI